jgi:hypothetical protein
VETDDLDAALAPFLERLANDRHGLRMALVERG